MDTYFERRFPTPRVTFAAESLLTVDMIGAAFWLARRDGALTEDLMRSLTNRPYGELEPLAASIGYVPRILPDGSLRWQSRRNEVVDTIVTQHLGHGGGSAFQAPAVRS